MFHLKVSWRTEQLIILFDVKMEFILRAKQKTLKQEDML